MSIWQVRFQNKALLNGFTSTNFNNAPLTNAKYRIRSDSEDMDLAKLALQIDAELVKLDQTNSIPKADLSTIKLKWNFIRKVVIQSNTQSSPFIVLLNGNKIIKILEGYY